MTRRVATMLLLAVLSTALGVFVAVSLFLNGSRTIVVAGHDTVVRPTLSRDAVLRTGPVLPDFRVRDVGPVGVTLTIGKTEAGNIEEAVERYAFIASEPDAQVAKVHTAVSDIALGAALRGLGVGLVPVVVFLLLGRHRRGELFRGVRSPQGGMAVVLLLALPVLVWQPWLSRAETTEDQRNWQTLAEVVGPNVALPSEAQDIEVLTGPATRQTKRLVLSAVDTYDKSKDFYRAAAEESEDLAEIRRPEEGENVALLVSDRHDNIGMDRVARAIGETAGATAVIDAGDDTSTGQPWEAFSLDSLADTFEDWDRLGVAGNHDHGIFVADYLADKGWTMLAGDETDAPWGGTVMGLDDPRSSGLGSWRDEEGLSFADVGKRLSEAVCDADERVNTLVIHDANLGRVALERGCVDLVVGGHTHVQEGPDAIVAEDGTVGYRFTNGTTGGAAYAIAIGSKPRRDADVSLITYRDGVPVGLQWVRLRTNGTFVVGPWSPIAPGAADPG